MTSKDFLNEYIEKKLIKPEKIGLDQIVKVIKSADKDLKVSEKLLSIDEGHAYEIAYTAREFIDMIKEEIKKELPQEHFKF